MTEKSLIANAPLTKLLSKTVGRFKVISETLDTVTVHEKGIHNTISMERLALATRDARGNHGTDRNGGILSAEQNRIEDGTDRNNDILDAKYCMNEDQTD